MSARLAALRDDGVEEEVRAVLDDQEAATGTMVAVSANQKRERPVRTRPGPTSMNVVTPAANVSVVGLLQATKAAPSTAHS